MNHRKHQVLRALRSPRGKFSQSTLSSKGNRGKDAGLSPTPICTSNRRGGGNPRNFPPPFDKQMLIRRAGPVRSVGQTCVLLPRRVKCQRCQSTASEVINGFFKDESNPALKRRETIDFLSPTQSRLLTLTLQPYIPFPIKLSGQYSPKGTTLCTSPRQLSPKNYLIRMERRRPIIPATDECVVALVIS